MNILQWEVELFKIPAQVLWGTELEVPKNEWLGCLHSASAPSGHSETADARSLSSVVNFHGESAGRALGMADCPSLLTKA